MSADQLEFRLVDAFAFSAYSGNVAAVVMNADGLSEHQMQRIAAEFNASETTFILPPTTKDAAVRFRWFTPGCEVSFCGHATLGGVHALLESGRFAHELKEPGTVLPIESRSGILTVRTESHPEAGKPPTIWLDMPHCDAKSKNVPLPALVEQLRLPLEALDPRIPAIRTHDDDVVLAVRDLQVLLGLAPPMGELTRYCRREAIRGILVTTTNALSRATVVQSRFFAPAAGIDEDPVTGSVHGPLGLHLVDCGIVPLTQGRADFFCAQAKAGGRAGIVRVVVSRSASGKSDVRIGGTCVTTAMGSLRVLPAQA
jgi:PhzF family phenazine biosynthesis protein